MKTVLFLGAGATRAQWEWANPQDNSETVAPPMDGDFMCLSWKCANDRPSFEKAAKSLGVSYEEERGMEAVFCDIMEKVSSSDENPNATLAWHHLVTMYRKLIAVSTNALSCSTNSALFTLMLRLEPAKLTRLSIITTNHDLVAERTSIALAEHLGLPTVPLVAKSDAARSQSLLTAMYPYLVPHKRRFFSANGPRWRGAWPKGIEVIKLHGSYNWWYPSLSNTEPIPQIDRLEETHICLDANPPILLKSSAHRLYPVIVPPIPDKFQYFSNLFSRLRGRARIALQECQLLIVFGYSMPPTDVEICDLFDSAFKHNRGLTTVAVINPDVTPALRLQRLLGTAGLVTYYDSLRTSLTRLNHRLEHAKGKTFAPTLLPPYCFFSVPRCLCGEVFNGRGMPRPYVSSLRHLRPATAGKRTATRAS